MATIDFIPVKSSIDFIPVEDSSIKKSLQKIAPYVSKIVKSAVPSVGTATLARPSIPGISQLADIAERAKQDVVGRAEESAVSSKFGGRFPITTAAGLTAADVLLSGSLRPEDIPAQIGGLAMMGEAGPKTSFAKGLIERDPTFGGTVSRISPSMETIKTRQEVAALKRISERPAVKPPQRQFRGGTPSTSMIQFKPQEILSPVGTEPETRQTVPFGGLKTPPGNLLLPTTIDFIPASREMAMAKTTKMPEITIVRPVTQGARDVSLNYETGKFEPTPEPIDSETPQTVNVFEPRQSQFVRDKVSELIDRHYVLAEPPSGKEIAPEFPQAGGMLSEPYVEARESLGKLRGQSNDFYRGLNEIIKPLKNYDDRSYFNLIYSMKNFSELDKAGRTTSGITEKIATERLNALRQEIGKERYQRIENVTDAAAAHYDQNSLRVLVDSGLITTEQAKRYAANFPHYLRSEIIDIDFGLVDDRGRSSFRINKDFLKTKEGTELQINTDVIDVMRRSYVEKLRSARRQVLVDQIAKTFGEPLGKQGTPNEVIRQKLSDLPNGYTPSSLKTSSGEVFAVRRDIANYIEGLNKQNVDLITRWLGRYNRIFREGATLYRTKFSLGHLQRAAESYLFNARDIKGQHNAMLSAAVGFGHAMADAFGVPTKLVKEFELNGGLYGGDYAYRSKDVPIPFRLLPLTEQAKTVFEFPLEALSKSLRASDNVFRYGEFYRTGETDLPVPLRIMQARDTTTDFEKYGDAFRLIAIHIPFTNDKVQFYTNSGRAFMDQPFRSAWRVGTYILAPTLALYAFNKLHTEEDKLVPMRTRLNYFYMHTNKMVYNNGNWVPMLLTWPKKGIYADFSNALTLLLDKAYNEPAFRQRLKEYSLRSIEERMASEIVPPIMKPILEDAFNVDFYSGNPILHQGIKDVEPKYQFLTGTTNTARKIGELTGASPARLEHFAKSAFPAAGELFELSDFLFNPNPEVRRRESAAAFKAQQFLPGINIPYGNYSVPEADMKDILIQEQRKDFTKRFLYKESLRGWLQTRDPEYAQSMRQAAIGMRGKDIKEVNKKVMKEVAESSKSREQRALDKVPKRYKSLIARQQFIGSTR